MGLKELFNAIYNDRDDEDDDDDNDDNDDNDDCNNDKGKVDKRWAA